MSDQDAAWVDATLEALKATAVQMGVADGVDPFMTLSFMSLPVIPAMRILTHGMYDVVNRQYRKG